MRHDPKYEWWEYGCHEGNVTWEFSNTQSWKFAGELSADGTTITGVTSSIQGGIPLEFRDAVDRSAATALGSRLSALAPLVRLKPDTTGTPRQIIGSVRL
jgi:hypothetical protein